MSGREPAAGTPGARAWRVEWRALRPGELDHERLWLPVLAGAAVAGWAWLEWGLPVPACPLHAWSGWPCPGCGTTRALRALLSGESLFALRSNPLASLAAGVAAPVYLAYAAAVLALGLPRLRVASVSPRGIRALRVAAWVALLGNWAWLVWAGV